MKRFLGYLYDCRYMWIWFILSGGAFVLCFALYEVELKAAVYPVLLSAVFGILFFVLGTVDGRKSTNVFFRSVRPAVSYRKVAKTGLYDGKRISEDIA